MVAAFGLPVLALILLDLKEGPPKYFWLDARIDYEGRWQTGTLYEYRDQREEPGRGHKLFFTDASGGVSSTNLSWVNYFPVPWQGDIPWSCAPVDRVVLSWASRYFRWFASSVGQSGLRSLLFGAAVMLIAAIASVGRPGALVRLSFFFVAIVALFVAAEALLVIDNDCARANALVRSRTTSTGRVLPLPAAEISGAMGLRSFIPWLVGSFLGFQVLFFRECRYAVVGTHFLLITSRLKRRVDAVVARERAPTAPEALQRALQHERRKLSPEQPPPAWQSENWLRRMKAWSARMVAEKELIESMYQYERSRAKRESAERNPNGRGPEETG